MIQKRCNRCMLPIPPLTAHVVQENAAPAVGNTEWHWHVDCWEALRAENKKRKAEQSKPKV